VKIMGEDIAVRAQIHTINGFSSHADAKDLLSWAKNFQPDTTFLITHGEPKPAKSLAVSLGNMGYHSVIPARRQSVTLRPRKERIAIPPPEAYTIGQKLTILWQNIHIKENLWRECLLPYWKASKTVKHDLLRRWNR